MLVDTHAHLNFNAYKDDADEVIRRSLDGGVCMINVGSQFSTSERAVKIAERYPEGVWAAIGLHPLHLETGLVKIKEDTEEIQFKTIEEEFDYEKYKALALSSKKVVAIGEIGLDYYHLPKTKIKTGQFKQKQKEIFLKQLGLAEELNLPVMVHCRSAHQDLIEVLKSEARSTKHEIKGVIHCFTGTRREAKQYMDMGLYLGFDGIIFKLNLDESIKEIPLERMLVETDCPYLSPLQESKRNEPIYAKHIVRKIADLKEETFEKVAEITTQNAKNLFNLNG